MSPKRKRAAYGAELVPSKTRKARKTSKKKKPTSTPTTPGFLRLPAELRNRIYEGVLLDPLSRRIAISQRVREPPLLLVSHQLRDEARPMFYLQNRFSIQIIDYNATNLVKFVKRIDLISADAECDLAVTVSGAPNRENLLEWCKAVHQDIGVESMDVSGYRMSSNERKAGRALQEAKKGRAVSWEKCLEMVEYVLKPDIR